MKIKLQKPENKYVKVKVTDRFGTDRYIQMHGYLIGMEAAFQVKKDNKLHNLVIITGTVGAGKSSLVQGLSGVNAKWNNQQLDFDNISWSTEKFIEKTDKEDNIGTPQWWDESIQGAGGRSMAITSMGNKLKMAFVTKRFKKHTYYLVIDEINEYSWKLIKMADAWINVRRMGLRRGYFDVYTKKKHIQFIYNAFKFYNATWNSKYVKNIYPCCKGKFENYEGLFLDEDEYNRLKLEETKQLEATSGVQWKKEKVRAFYYWAKGHKFPEIEDYVGVKASTIRNWATDFKKIVLPES